MEHICIVTQTGLNEVGSIDLLPDMDDETRVGIGELTYSNVFIIGDIFQTLSPEFLVEEIQKANALHEL